MPCYHPLTAYRTESGDIQFHDKGDCREITLNCGQCTGCRLERSRQWAMRCVHEAQQYDDNCFITLTYNPENLPADAGLRLKHFQEFMKRLRKKYVPKNPYPRSRDKESDYQKFRRKHWIRFYHCGEYGDKNNRPHYHAILFNFNFPDWVYLYTTDNGSDIYTSPTLEEIWGKGFVTIGTVTFESAAYIARYVMKKINGKFKNKKNPETGLKPYERYTVDEDGVPTIVEVLPEYTTMSRDPGIGSDWFDRYHRDCYPKDFTTIRGTRCKPPKYYDGLLKEMNPQMYDDIKAGRELKASENWQENSPERLKAKEAVKEAQLKTLKRSL
jgi:hypothetical protein